MKPASKIKGLRDADTEKCRVSVIEERGVTTVTMGMAGHMPGGNWYVTLQASGKNEVEARTALTRIASEAHATVTQRATDASRT